MLADLVQARIVAGEAALRGVSVDPDEVAAAVAREQLHSGGEAYWRSSLEQRGIDEGEARAQIAERVLSDALVDAITAAKADARTWGATFDAMHARWRAVTTCAATVALELSDLCSNHQPPGFYCRWLGVGVLCPLTHDGPTRRWGGFVDLAGILNPEWSGALCQPGDAKVLPRLRAYLKRTAPGVLRRATFDADCDPQTLQTPRRADLVVILHAVARIAAAVRRG
jgi:hypothetical protein